MHRPGIRSVIAVAALVALAIWLFGHPLPPAGLGPAEDHQGAQDGGDGSPHLRGSTKRANAQTVPDESSRTRLHGKVVREDGGDLEEVQVYLIRKDAEANTTPAAPTRPDAGGRWSLDADRSGHWLVAVADGLAPASLDGDEVAEQPVELRLDAGRSIKVIVGNLHLLAGATALVRITPLDASARTWPGAAQCRPFEREVPMDLSGEMPVQVPTHGPVRVVVTAPGLRAQPFEQTVEPDERYAEFDLRNTCILVVRVTDAETGWFLNHDATATVPGFSMEDPGNEPFRLENIPVHGLMNFMYGEGLPLGLYDLHISCEGYEPVWFRDLDLESPGSRKNVDVALKPDPARAGVRLALRRSDGEGLGGLEPSVLIRRLDLDGEEEPDWAWAYDRDKAPDEARVRLGLLVPGRYEVYAWAGDSYVGRTEVRAVGGGIANAEITLERGILVDLLQGGTLDPELHENWLSVRLNGARGQPLPPIRFPRHQPNRESIFKGHTSADAVTKLDAVIGPLPSERIYVTTERDGETRTWTVKPTK